MFTRNLSIPRIAASNDVASLCGTDPLTLPDLEAAASGRWSCAGRSAPVRVSLIRPMVAVLSLALLVSACGGAADTADSNVAVAGTAEATDDFDDDDMAGRYDNATIDSGPRADLTKRASAATSATSFAPTNGGPLAHIQGAFGPVIPWPLIAIHAVLLPDGRVLSYGSNLVGAGGADLHYAIWDPALGGGAEAMMTLSNTTRTDIFCGGQIVVPGTGQVLLLGGTRRDAYGRSSNGVNDVGLFDPATNAMTKQAESMADRRWYATVVTTPEGDQVVMGGRGDKDYPWTIEIPVDVEATYAPTPVVYRNGQGWRTLGTATSSVAYGNASSYGYPRAWWAPNGTVFVLTQLGEMFSLDTSGTGSLLPFSKKAPRGSSYFSSAMFAPGKILSLRTLGRAVVIDINGQTPLVTPTQPISTDRYDGVVTVLADGQVWANGGSTERQNLSTAIYQSEMWNPTTEAWTPTASATKSRLYHSSALLLPDATVLTAGGGRPGPVRNLNAEVYFPPYLFKLNGSGELAVRPVIQNFPVRSFAWSESVSFQLAGTAQTSRVTMVRSGSMTHSFNNEQRFMDASFSQVGSTVTVVMPADPNIAPPGYYMMFVFNENGIPSIAKMVKISG